jgi:hypothetical protein
VETRAEIWGEFASEGSEGGKTAKDGNAARRTPRKKSRVLVNDQFATADSDSGLQEGIVPSNEDHH